MTKTVRVRYALNFKQEAALRVKRVQRIAAAAKSLGVADPTLLNWVKAQRLGKLRGADSKVVSAEQMEHSRLRVELARVKMGRNILEKATAYSAKVRPSDALSTTMRGWSVSSLSTLNRTAAAAGRGLGMRCSHAVFG